jgi:N-methylhydantoinase B
MPSSVDPLTLGSVWRSLRAAANDAGQVLQRTAYSEAVREGRDFSVALFDQQGRMVAQGDFSPGHLGSMPETVQHVLDVYPRDQLRPGDAVLFNDPWLGSGHLPDFLLTAPVFAEEELVGYVVSCVHMIDVGGAVAGSQAVGGVNEVYQEGLRLPPTLLWRADEPNDELLRVIQSNVRLPDKLLGDLLAMRSCIHVGQGAIADLIERVGMDTYHRACEEILEQSERAMRESIAELSDGTYSASDELDDSGPDTEPVPLKVSLTVAGDELTIDFEGSGKQTPSGMNAVANYCKAYCYFTVKAVLHGPNLPQNAGSIRPIMWKAPLGSAVNAEAPISVGARAIMQQRIVDVLMEAFVYILPEQVVAPSSHWANPTMAGVDDRNGRPFVLYDVIVGGWGGRFGRDGVEAMCPSFNVDGIPVEVNEHSYPILVERYSLIPESAGPGKWRGGHGIRKDIRVLTNEVQLMNLGERHRVSPPGLLGGRPGRKAQTVINPDRQAETIHSKGKYRLQEGDVVSHRLSGGGGYGSPLERDPDLVARDVVAGFLSSEHAREHYGVIVSAEGEVDLEATTAQRAGAESNGSGGGGSPSPNPSPHRNPTTIGGLRRWGHRSGR